MLSGLKITLFFSCLKACVILFFNIFIPVIRRIVLSPDFGGGCVCNCT